MEIIIKCPICRGTEIVSFLKCKDYTISKEYYTISKCIKCNFKFTNPRPDSTEIGKFYESDEYISHSDSAKGIINHIYKIVRTYTLNKKVELINKLSCEKNILDIGCGTGAFLNHCSKNDWETYGVEPNEGARKFADENYKLKINKEEELTHFPTNSFPIITMWHVLEHVHLLNERINEIKRLLKKDGTLIIAVPNSNSWDAEHYKENWAAYDLPRHLYHFSPKTLGLLLNNHGLKIINKLPMKFDSYYISLLSEKYIPGNTNILKGIINGFRSNLMGTKDINKYSSIIYIIKNA